MKLGTLLWRGALVAAIGAGLAQYWLVQRTHEVAARLTSRLVPHGELRYERLWPFLWGGGRAWGVSFQPDGMLRIALQTAPGLRIQARELRIHEIRFGDNGTLERLRGSLIDVRLPVAELRAPSTTEGTEVSKIPAPTLFDLGYPELKLDMDFDVQYVAAENHALVELNLAGRDTVRAFLSAQLEGTPYVFDRAPDQILVRKLELEVADEGLLKRFKEVSAARARLDRPSWEGAMVQHLDRRAAKEHWKWDEQTARAVRGAVRDSGYFRAVIDPPGDVALRNIRLYAVADWPPLLGFGFANEGTFDHPVPIAGRR